MNQKTAMQNEDCRKFFRILASDNRWIQKKPFLIQNRIRNGFLFVFKFCHFLQQILLVIVQLYKIVGFSQKVLAKKKKQYNMYNDIDQSSRINLSLRIYQVGGDRNMNRYSISFKHSDDGEHWYTTSRMVEAESDFSAMEIIKSGYPYVQIISVRKIG